jgi:hypothetical protein
VNEQIPTYRVELLPALDPVFGSAEAAIDGVAPADPVGPDVMELLQRVRVQARLDSMALRGGVIRDAHFNDSALALRIEKDTAHRWLCLRMEGGRSVWAIVDHLPPDEYFLPPVVAVRLIFSDCAYRWDRTELAASLVGRTIAGLGATIDHVYLYIGDPEALTFGAIGTDKGRRFLFWQ